MLQGKSGFFGNRTHKKKEKSFFKGRPENPCFPFANDSQLDRREIVIGAVLEF